MTRQIMKDKAEAHGLLEDISGDPEVFLELLNDFYKEMFEHDLSILMDKKPEGVRKVSENLDTKHSKEPIH